MFSRSETQSSKTTSQSAQKQTPLIQDIVIVRHTLIRDAVLHRIAFPHGQKIPSFWGEYGQKSDEEGDDESRLYDSIVLFFEKAADKHYTYCDADGKLKPEYTHCATQLTTSEGAFYKRKPFSLAEFEQFQQKIATLARQYPDNLYLALSSFPVQTEDNKLMNVVVRVACGSTPHMHFRLKNREGMRGFDPTYTFQNAQGETVKLPYINEQDDVSNYKIMIDGIEHPLSRSHVIEYTLANGTHFFSITELCRDHAEGLGHSEFDGYLDHLSSGLKIRDLECPEYCSHVVSGDGTTIFELFSLGNVTLADSRSSEDLSVKKGIAPNGDWIPFEAPFGPSWEMLAMQPAPLSKLPQAQLDKVEKYNRSHTFQQEPHLLEEQAKKQRSIPQAPALPQQKEPAPSEAPHAAPKDKSEQKAASTALIEATNAQQWDTVTALCARKDIKLEAQAVAHTLAMAARFGKKEVVRFLCTNKMLQQETLNNALREASTGINPSWAIADYLIRLEIENKPNQEAVSAALIEAANKRRWDIVRLSCSLVTENKPYQAAVNYTLQKASTGANPSWAIVKYLCNLQTENKPDQVTVSDTLIEAVNAREWDTIEFLCSMQAENRPGTDAVAYALARAAFYGQEKLVKTLCVMQTKSKPNQEAISKALNAASDGQKWLVMRYLCSLKTENKPDAQTVAQILEKAACIGEIKWVTFLCTMQTENKPSEDAISAARQKAIVHGQRAVVAYFDRLQTDEANKKVSICITEKTSLGEQTPQKTPAAEKALNNLDLPRELSPDQLEEPIPHNQAEQAEQQHQEEQQRQHQLAEEARIQARRNEEQRQRVIATSLSLIDDALGVLEGQIGLDDQHHSSQATNVATLLLNSLYAARNNYSDALNRPGVNIAQASTAFKRTCISLIEEASPILERDLGLGDRLGNALKAFINAVIGLVTENRSAFFSPTRSTAIIAVEQAEQSLDVLVPCVPV